MQRRRLGCRWRPIQRTPRTAPHIPISPQNALARERQAACQQPGGQQYHRGGFGDVGLLSGIERLVKRRWAHGRPRRKAMRDTVRLRVTLPTAKYAVDDRHLEHAVVPGLRRRLVVVEHQQILGGVGVASSAVVVQAVGVQDLDLRLIVPAIALRGVEKVQPVPVGSAGHRRLRHVVQDPAVLGRITYLDHHVRVVVTVPRIERQRWTPADSTAFQVTGGIGRDSTAGQRD